MLHVGEVGWLFYFKFWSDKGMLQWQLGNLHVEVVQCQVWSWSRDQKAAGVFQTEEQQETAGGERRVDGRCHWLEPDTAVSARALFTVGWPVCEGLPCPLTLVGVSVRSPPGACCAVCVRVCGCARVAGAWAAVPRQTQLMSTVKSNLLFVICDRPDKCVCARARFVVPLASVRASLNGAHRGPLSPPYASDLAAEQQVTAIFLLLPFSSFTFISPVVILKGGISQNTFYLQETSACTTNLALCRHPMLKHLNYLYLDITVTRCTFLFVRSSTVCVVELTVCVLYVHCNWWELGHCRLNIKYSEDR